MDTAAADHWKTTLHYRDNVGRSSGLRLSLCFIARRLLFFANELGRLADRQPRWVEVNAAAENKLRTCQPRVTEKFKLYRLLGAVMLVSSKKKARCRPAEASTDIAATHTANSSVKNNGNDGFLETELGQCEFQFFAPFCSLRLLFKPII